VKNSERIWELVDQHRAEFCELSDDIWEHPEIAYGEWHAVAAHGAALKAQGFRVTEAPGGIPTAVIGEAGEGGPVIAFLGEYDALPGLCQEAGLAAPKMLPGDGIGHGCGHNLLGAGALLAATAVKNWLAEKGLPGRVRYYGCPAEEGGAAKGFLVRAGAFKDVDAAISWHPSAFFAVNDCKSLANMRLDFSFTGRASHAAAAPHLGRSALDAAELMNVGVNYLREHMASDSRVHYAYLDAGGVAPNVVQAHTKIRYLVRTRTLPELMPLVERVKKIAQGAALMTETEVSWKVVTVVSNLLNNTPLEEAMMENFTRLGAPEFDEQDRKLAREIRSTLSGEDIRSAFMRFGLPYDAEKPLCDAPVPLEAKARGAAMMGSTDVGDVSWSVPTVQADGATYAIGTPGHSWQLTAQGKSGIAHKGMVHTAKVMAGTAIDLLTRPDLLARAKADYAERTSETPYVCPLPDDVMPPLRPRPVAAE
jgi:aminobenzoyl-glutamate utilization protein B